MPIESVVPISFWRRCNIIMSQLANSSIVLQKETEIFQNSKGVLKVQRGLVRMQRVVVRVQRGVIRMQS